ncbi:hypothetical protein Bbelb_167890 [Branchiostoma belcheri]|nr:hypothetical protein Bbelb_167890 [Branchiostoma belcheri]
MLKVDGSQCNRPAGAHRRCAHACIIQEGSRGGQQRALTFHRDLYTAKTGPGDAQCRYRVLSTEGVRYFIQLSAEKLTICRIMLKVQWSTCRKWAKMSVAVPECGWQITMKRGDKKRL